MAPGDRLSALPDDILHDILALLNIDDAVRTCVLSSRWARLWSSNQFLNFSSLKGLNEVDLISIVDHCLILSSAIQKLCSVRYPIVNRPGIASALAVRRWLRFAADRHVEELVLAGGLSMDLLEIPRVLFECRSLSALKMEGISIRSVPLGTNDIKFKLLKTVILDFVSVGDDALNALLSNCPMIETLALISCSELNRIVIQSPTMRSLTVNDCYHLDQLDVVWAPQLTRLKYAGDILKVEALEGLSNLEEAAIICCRSRTFDSRQQWKHFISTFARVKVLSVDSWFFEFPLKEEQDSANDVVFSNLKEFHWRPERESTSVPTPWSAEDLMGGSLSGMVFALRHCPYLERLCIHCSYFGETRDYPCNSMEGNVHVLEPCETSPLQEFKKANLLLPHLKRFKLLDFSCKKAEVQLVKFLLREAAELESVVLYYAPKVEEMLPEMHRVIDSSFKASQGVHVSLSETRDDSCEKLCLEWWEC